MRKSFTLIAVDERGNSFVEMALAMPVLATLLVGTVDISRAVSTKLEVVQAAQRTIELVQRDEFKTSDLPTLKTEAAAAADVDESAVTVAAWLECANDGKQLDYDDACSDGTPFARYATVSITKNFSPMFGTKYFPSANVDGTFTLTGRAGVRVQ